MADITVIGNSVIDVIAHPVSKDVFDKDTSQTQSIILSYGGDALNESVVLSGLGKSVELITKTGSDDAGRKIKDYLGSVGVSAEKIISDPGIETSVNVILGDDTGERHIIANPAGSQRMLSEEDIYSRLDGCGSIVSFASMFISFMLDIDAMTRVFRRIKEKGCTLVVDMSSAKKGESIRDLEGLLPYVDYILPNINELNLLSGGKDVYDAINDLTEAGAGCVIVKCSENGCILADKKRIYHVPAYKVKKCVDSTGAGDSFAAGFIWALSEGWEVHRCAAFAAAVASFCVECTGASGYKISVQEAMKRFSVTEKDIVLISNKTLFSF